MTRPELLDDLHRARERGVAECRDELEIALSAVAAPVQDSTGIVAALSVSGPSVRVFGPRHEMIVDAVRAGALLLSIQMGSVPPVSMEDPASTFTPLATESGDAELP